MSNLVIGQTGFIGNSIYSKLNNVVPFKPISWSTNDLEEEFSKLDNTKTYSLFWAAGNNNNNSTVSKIKEEIDSVLTTVKCLKKFNLKIDNCNIISSAGAIYAGSVGIINELVKENPISEYGKSRIEIEKIFTNLAQELQINLNIFRLTNVFGSKVKNNTSSGLINNLVESNFSRKYLNIFVSLFTRQDYVDLEFVTNNICQISKTGLSNQYKKQIYILSRNYSHSIQEIITIIDKITHKKTLYVMQFDSNSRVRNSNMFFQINNSSYLKYKINPIDLEIRKLIVQAMSKKIA